MSNVISIRAFKALKDSEAEELAYQARILSMSKVELLEEMVRFQEDRKAEGHLTADLMFKGKHLFKALEECADSQELKILSRSYRRHLDYEIAALREVGEETGLRSLAIRGLIDTIDWEFRFRGQVIHKVCHFFLMESIRGRTSPQRAEGITACRWMSFDEALRVVSYKNAREVLRRAHGMVAESAVSA